MLILIEPGQDGGEGFLEGGLAFDDLLDDEEDYIIDIQLQVKVLRGRLLEQIRVLQLLCHSILNVLTEHLRDLLLLQNVDQLLLYMDCISVDRLNVQGHLPIH